MKKLAWALLFVAVPASAVVEFYSPRNTTTRAPVDFRAAADGAMISGVTGGACLCTTHNDGTNPGTFSTCTNGPTEIATASGAYYVQLTAAETNADYTLLKCTSNESMPFYSRITHKTRGVNWGEVDNAASAVVLSGTTVGTVTTNTDMRGTDSALLAASAPTNFGDLAITATTGYVTAGTNNDKTGYSLTNDQSSVTIGTVNTLTGHTPQTGDSYTRIGALGAGLTDLGGMSTNMQNQTTAATQNAIQEERLHELMNAALASQPAVGSLMGDLTQDKAGTQQFTATALELAPTGGGGGDVNVASWNGVSLATTNPLPNAAPATDGGLPTVTAGSLTQPVTAQTVNDKSGYTATVTAYSGTLDFNSLQKASVQAESTVAIQNERLHELMNAQLSAQPQTGSMFADLTEDNAGTQRFTADALSQAPTAGTGLTAEEFRMAIGGFGATITSVNSSTEFALDNGPAVGDSLNDEFTAIITDTSSADMPTCHRQVRDWLASQTLVIDSECPVGFPVSVGDKVVVLPNGAGSKIAEVNVSNGGVDVNLGQLADGSLTLGCLLAAVNAVESGARTATDDGGGSWTYTYRNPGDTQDRVVAQFNNNTGVRNQATITCP